MAKQVFVSYSRKDYYPFVQKFLHDLSKLGVNLWLDQGGIHVGERWDTAIEEALNESEFFIVILSPNSVQSENVLDEIVFALKEKMHIFPVMYKDCKIPFNLARVQYIDFREDYQSGLNRLVEELSQAGVLIHRGPSKPTAQPPQIQPAPPAFSIPRWAWLLGGLVGVSIVLLAAFIYLFFIGAIVPKPETPSQQISQNPSPEITQTVELKETEKPTEAAIIMDTPTLSPVHTALPPTLSNNTAIPTEQLLETRINDGNIPMALVPAGPFLMGSESNLPETLDERPVHTVNLDAFYIDIYEVTNARYSECVVTGACNPPIKTSFQKQGEYYNNPAFANYPVNYVTWFMARTYCEWRGARLPTEAEWEKAARGGLEGRLYPWGDEQPVCQKGASNGAQFTVCGNNTSPVGSFSPNGYGLFDMAGNVWEWVMDWYSDTYYGNSISDDPVNLEPGQDRGMRGGSWDLDSSYLRVANRDQHNPTDSYSGIGFRCTRVP